MLKFKKTVSIGIAMLMSASAMCTTGFAQEANEDTWDFYNTKQILTFNPETQEFDSEFVERTSVLPFTLPGYTFTFNQAINSKGSSFLYNTSDKTGYPECYQITDDDTICIRLNEKPEERIAVQICETDGTPYGPAGTIKTSQVEIELDDLYAYYGSIGTLKIRMTSASSVIRISGTVSEN